MQIKFIKRPWKLHHQKLSKASKGAPAPHEWCKQMLPRNGACSHFHLEICGHRCMQCSTKGCNPNSQHGDLVRIVFKKKLGCIVTTKAKLDDEATRITRIMSIYQKLDPRLKKYTPSALDQMGDGGIKLVRTKLQKAPGASTCWWGGCTAPAQHAVFAPWRWCQWAVVRMKCQDLSSLFQSELSTF